MSRVRKIEWLPYHKALLADQSRYVAVEKSRRVGFDYCMAYKHTMQRASGENDRHLWYTSADESAAAEFIEYCKFFLERAQAVAQAFEEILPEAEDHKGAVKAFCLKFPNGARINALSSSPRRLRSKGGDVLISELAFHDDPVKLYAAAQPVMMWGGRMEIGTTHNGEDSIWNKRILADARAYAAGERERGGRPLTPWSHHYVDIFRAVDDGLVELINREKKQNFTREEFLQDLRAGCLTEDDWLQEYCCKPSSETSAWLPYQLIATCEDPSCPQPGDPLADGELGEVRYAGIDVGRKKDLTVCWVWGQVGDVLVTRQIVVLEKTPLPQQIRILEGVLRQARVRRSCVDATGIGLGLAEGLQERLGTSVVEDVTFSEPVKVALAVPLKRAFEDRTLRIPDHVEVREDLHKVRKVVTATGHVRFAAKSDDEGHADRFWAAALGVQASETGTGIMVSLVDPDQPAANPQDDVDPVEMERRARAVQSAECRVQS